MPKISKRVSPQLSYYRRNRNKCLAKRKIYTQSHKKESAAYQRAYRKRDPQRFAGYEQKRKVKRRLWYRSYRLRFPLKHKNKNLKWAYKIDLKQYYALFKAQQGRCVICDKRMKKHGKTGACVDHCHNTKRVRGLLCQMCNGGLGMFKDNQKLLRRAIKYLANKP